MGAAGITWYGVLWAAASNDQIAHLLQIPLYTVTWIFRVLACIGPLVAFLATRMVCRWHAALQQDEQIRDREKGG